MLGAGTAGGGAEARELSVFEAMLAILFDSGAASPWRGGGAIHLFVLGKATPFVVEVVRARGLHHFRTCATSTTDCVSLPETKICAPLCKFLSDSPW